MKRGRAQAGEESSHREVDEQLIVCRRRRAIDSRDVDEGNPRDRRADQGRVLPRRQLESAHEAFSRVCAPISKGCRLDPLTALEGEERPRFCRPHDDRLASDGPEAQDLRAHDLDSRMQGEILHEALVDRVGSAALRDEVCVAREDPSRQAREGRKDRPRGPEQERAEEQAREGTRPNQDGTAPFVRTRTAARRDGTRPARTAATRGRPRARGVGADWTAAMLPRTNPIAPSVSSRVSRRDDTAAVSSGAAARIAWTGPPCVAFIAMRRSARTYAQLSGKSSERVGGGATIGRSVRCSSNRLTFPEVATGIPLSASICARNPASRDTFRGPAGNAIVPTPS